MTRPYAFVVSSVSKTNRPIRAKRRRQRKKCWLIAQKRWWDRLPNEDRDRRLIEILAHVFPNTCRSCGDELGSNLGCTECLDSLPELTEEEKQAMDCFQPDFIERLFERAEHADA